MRISRRFVKPVFAAILMFAAPAAPTAENKIPPFSPDTLAFLVKQQVDFGARVPGSPASKKMQALITDTLRPRADLFYTVTGTVVSDVDGRTYPVTSFYARFHAKAASRILLAAHYDSRPWADQDPDPAKRRAPVPGANDGASGTAVLLDLARYLNNLPESVGVDLALIDGEDLGAYADPESFTRGAAVVADWLKKGNLKPPLPAHGIVIDMVGSPDAEFYTEAFSLSADAPFVNMLWKVAGELHLPAFKRADNDTGPQPVYDDHLPFIRAGIPTALIIGMNYRPWHTTADTPDKVSGEALARIEKLLWTFLSRPH